MTSSDTAVRERDGVVQLSHGFTAAMSDVEPLAESLGVWKMLAHTANVEAHSLRHRGEDVREHAEQLMVVWVEIISQLEMLGERNAALQKALLEARAELYEAQQDEDYGLAQTVRQVHDDQHHRYGWAVCPDRSCRAASRVLA